jgi:hypothetical protein
MEVTLAMKLDHISVADLENTARALDLQIHKLERRGSHMTPPEHMRSVELKKLRLVTKDRLADLSR